MAGWTDQHLKHLYNRFGFGLKAFQFTDLTGRPKQEVIDEIFKRSKRQTSLDTIKPLQQVAMLNTLSEEEKKNIFGASAQNILRIGLNWVDLMVHDPAQLRERMVLFWHDHFASSSLWDVQVYQQNETLRQHALGNFRDLLKAMCHDPMLLKFLNNDSNRKQSPNENFTRELLELFTLGEGHYTEGDIREGGRAFTGHSNTLQGDYIFRPQAHDYGEKTFMGRTGRFDGDDIVDMILEKKQVAIHITKKIYRYFVNTEIDTSLIDQLSEAFYSSGYDIELLMRMIAESDWFYEKGNIGTKVKSPIDLVVGMMKHCAVEFKDHKLLVGISRIMGQVPFHPPNVSGWPIGKQWIDSSSLLFRMRLADFLFLGQKINKRSKDPLTMENRKPDNNSHQSNNALNFDLSGLRKLSGSGTSKEKLRSLAGFLLNTDPENSKEVLLQWAMPVSKNDDLMILNLLRLPEYQLC